MAIAKRSPAGTILHEIMSQNSHNYLDHYKEEIKMSIRSASSSRRITYLEINQELAVHDMYMSYPIIPEVHRIAASRLRLGAHRLKIETGRWSRLPRELRLCTCGEVQTELHALCQCPLTQHIRDLYPYLDFTNLNSLMSNPDTMNICKFCFCVLYFFANNV